MLTWRVVLEQATRVVGVASRARRLVRMPVSSSFPSRAAAAARASYERESAELTS